MATWSHQNIIALILYNYLLQSLNLSVLITQRHYNSDIGQSTKVKVRVIASHCFEVQLVSGVP